MSSKGPFKVILSVEDNTSSVTVSGHDECPDFFGVFHHLASGEHDFIVTNKVKVDALIRSASQCNVEKAVEFLNENMNNPIRVQLFYMS